MCSPARRRRCPVVTCRPLTAQSQVDIARLGTDIPGSEAFHLAGRQLSVRIQERAVVDFSAHVKVVEHEEVVGGIGNGLEIDTVIVALTLPIGGIDNFRLFEAVVQSRSKFRFRRRIGDAIGIGVAQVVSAYRLAILRGNTAIAPYLYEVEAFFLLREDRQLVVSRRLGRDTLDVATDHLVTNNQDGSIIDRGTIGKLVDPQIVIIGRRGVTVEVDTIIGSLVRPFVLKGRPLVLVVQSFRDFVLPDAVGNAHVICLVSQQRLVDGAILEPHLVERHRGYTTRRDIPAIADTPCRKTSHLRSRLTDNTITITSLNDRAVIVFRIGFQVPNGDV